MTITEQRVLKQVTILPESGAVNIQWANQIMRDDVLISETFERKAYTVDQKDEFMQEVQGAATYVAAMGW